MTNAAATVQPAAEGALAVVGASASSAGSDVSIGVTLFFAGRVACAGQTKTNATTRLHSRVIVALLVFNFLLLKKNLLNHFRAKRFVPKP